MLANIHSILACDVPHTEDVGLPNKFWFNCRPASQPIARSMPVKGLRGWPNTNPSLNLLYTLGKHVAFTQCCFKVDPQSLMLAEIATALCDCTLFSDCCIRVTMHYSNQNLLSSNHYISSWKYSLSEHFLKTKVLNLGTSNVILDMFIRTGVQRCQPFPTHSTPPSPKWDTNSGKNKLINLHAITTTCTRHVTAFQRIAH